MKAKREAESPAARAAGAQPQAGARKRYQKPAFRSERVFEQTALACGKVSATQSSCKFNRKRS